MDAKLHITGLDAIAGTRKHWQSCSATAHGSIGYITVGLLGSDLWVEVLVHKVILHLRTLGRHTVTERLQALRPENPAGGGGGGGRKGKHSQWEHMRTSARASCKARPAVSGAQ